MTDRVSRIASLLALESGIAVDDARECVRNALVVADEPLDDGPPIGLEAALTDALYHRVWTRPASYACIARRDVAGIARAVATAAEGA